MSSTKVINLPVGVVTAILTTSEFILSFIATIAGGAAVRGVWLMYLHRGGTASVTARSRSRRLIIRDFVSFAMAFWLVVSVAMVESNFEQTYVLTEQSKFSPRCLRMDQRVDPVLMDTLIPPLHLRIDEWILECSEDLRCINGIATVGLELETNGNGTKKMMNAPVCAMEQVVLNDIKIFVRAIKISSSSLTVVQNGHDFFEFFPYESPNIHNGSDPSVIASPNHTSPNECTKRHIGGPPIKLHTMWRTLVADGEQVSNMIQYELCRLHGDKPVATIQQAVEESCGSPVEVTTPYDSEHKLDPSCIRDHALRIGVPGVYHTTLLQNMSVQFHFNNGTTSFACLDAVVQVHYVFVSSEFLRHSGFHAHSSEMPVIVPFGAAVIRGHCERTLNVLGRAALLFSADSEWRNTFSSSIGRVPRYHANMMAVSSSLFPLDQMSEDTRGSNRSENSGTVHLNGPNLAFARYGNSKCRVRIVKQATGILIDGSFHSLTAATMVCSLLVLTAMILRLTAWISGHSWTVGSAKWALTEIAKRGATDLQIVVQSVDDVELGQGDENGVEATNGDRNYTEHPTPRLQRSQGSSHLSSPTSLTRSQSPKRILSEGRLARSRRQFISRINYELTFVHLGEST